MGAAAVCEAEFSAIADWHWRRQPASGRNPAAGYLQ